jgi:5-methylcytosine-specific restriction endonuclease McrA
MATPKLPFDSVEDRFMQKSRELYNNMKQRFSEKRNKRDRIIRVGRTLPFDLAQFRLWLAHQLGGENGVIKCRYCAQFVTIDDMVLDHAMPLSQGGSIGFENLHILCKLHNDQKGGMCSACFDALLNWSAGCVVPAGIHNECRNEMLHRLAIAVQLAAQRRWDIVKKAKEQAKQEQQIPEEVF